MKPENEEKVTGLPENAYRELKEASYVSQQTLSGGYALVRPLGIGHGGDIQRGGRLSGPEGRSSIRGRHPDRYHRRRVVQRIQAEERLGRERHHPVYRGQ